MADQAPSVAASPPAPDATAEARQKCLALSAAARERALKEDFKGATALYRQAYETFPSADVLFMLAASEQKAGFAVDALAHFRAYLSDTDATAERRTLTRTTFIPKAFGETGHIALDTTPLAPVYIDGKLLDAAYWTPRVGPDTRTESQKDEGGDGPNVLMVDVAPGAHEVTAVSKARKMRWHASVTLKAGETAHPSFDVSDFTPASGAAVEPVKR